LDSNELIDVSLLGNFSNHSRFDQNDENKTYISESTNESYFMRSVCSNSVNPNEIEIDKSNHLTIKVNTNEKIEDFCALKLVSKEVFWDRVKTGKERGDSLVREVLSQVLRSSHFLAPLSLMQLESNFLNNRCSLNDISENSQIPIVQIFSIFETMKGFSLELELMESMDLFDKMSQLGRMEEHYVRQVVSQLVEAVALCNRLGIAHRDIKLSNITFPINNHHLNDDEDEEEDFIAIKLADFGMAGFVGSDRKLRGRCGTPGYIAPDILKAGVNECYGLNVDMFSVGKFIILQFYVFLIIFIYLDWCCCLHVT
jgi:serine/threonine protein kinase